MTPSATGFRRSNARTPRVERDQTPLPAFSLLLTPGLSARAIRSIDGPRTGHALACERVRPTGAGGGGGNERETERLHRQQGLPTQTRRHGVMTHPVSRRGGAPAHASMVPVPEGREARLARPNPQWAVGGVFSALSVALPAPSARAAVLRAPSGAVGWVSRWALNWCRLRYCDGSDDTGARVSWVY